MSDGEVLGFPHGYGQSNAATLQDDSVDGLVSVINPAPMKSYHSKPMQSPAGKILDTARDLIEGDREIAHGNRLECHTQIAALWGVYLDRALSPKDVALMMALLKIARVKTGEYNGDCFIDGAGYFSLAGEFAETK